MATPSTWWARNNFKPSDFIHSDDLNNLANDIRTWGGDVNGGGHRLSNVILSGSGGFQYYVSPMTITPGPDGQSLTAYSVPGAMPTDPPVIYWTAGMDGATNYAITRYDNTGTKIDSPVYIDRATGQVGINNVTPHVALDVYGTIGMQAPLGSTDPRPDLNVLYPTEITGLGSGIDPIVSGSADGFLRLSAGASGQKSYIDMAGYYGNPEVTRSIVFGTQSQERMRVDASGNVGINLITPQAFGKLQVRAAIDQNVIVLQGFLPRISAFTDANAYQGLEIDAAPLLLNQESGANVGIGVYPPVYRLDVGGDINITGSGAFRINGVPFTGGGSTDLDYLGNYAPGTYNDGDIVIASDGIAYMCVKDGTTAAPVPWPSTGGAAVIGIAIDGGGSAPTTGIKGYVSIPYSCVINSWDIVADNVGSISIDICKRANAKPNTTTDKISGSNPIALVSSDLLQGGSVSGWTNISILTGDVVAFNVTSATTLTRVTVSIRVTK